MFAKYSISVCSMYILDCPLPAISHLQPQSTIFAAQFLNVGGKIESLTFPHTTLFRSFITLHPDLNAIHKSVSIAWRDLCCWENRSRHEEYRFWIAHCLRYHNSNHSQRHSMSIIQCQWQFRMRPCSLHYFQRTSDMKGWRSHLKTRNQCRAANIWNRNGQKLLFAPIMWFRLSDLIEVLMNICHLCSEACERQFHSQAWKI